MNGFPVAQCGTRLSTRSRSSCGGLFWAECDGIEFKSGVDGGDAIESSGAESVTVPPPDAVGGLLRIAGFVVVVIAKIMADKAKQKASKDGGLAYGMFGWSQPGATAAPAPMEFS